MIAYDYLIIYSAGGKRYLKELKIEKLLFRKPSLVFDVRINESYKDKVILITVAHKQVSLLEHNCIKTIYNNVLGTLNLVKFCEEYKAERFIMA